MDRRVSGHCKDCYGSGSQRFRDQIGVTRTKICKHCGGKGRKFMIEGSGEHRISDKIIQGLGPGIRKGHSQYEAAGGVKQYGRR